LNLGLGTAQFGAHYGISNLAGSPTQAEINAIMETAEGCGIVVVDTAPAYGSSEAKIGNALRANHRFRIVTKTPALETKEVGRHELECLRASLEQSLKHLHQDQIYGLLVHRVDDLFLPGGTQLIEAMQEMVAAKRLQHIGVSVYNAQQIDQVLELFTPSLIQVPLNVFDQRLVHSGHLRHLKAKGIEIHARSVFLQGLLLMEPERLPDYFLPIQERFRAYRNLLASKHLCPIEGALSFPSQIPEVDVVLIGVNRPAELREIVDGARSAHGSRLDMSALAVDDEAMINPSLWKV
jgi:aryl-alcohol dehydrogenase-like predicted oxidoreductase